MSIARKRLLFVDDEPGIRNTLPVILRKYGLGVTVAATVNEALSEINAHTFDLLLCDLNLEREHDGFDVVRAFRKAAPDGIVVILTAYPDVDSAIEGIREHIDDYVIKPSNPDALVTILANSLAKRMSQDPLRRSLVSSLGDSLN